MRFTSLLFLTPLLFFSYTCQSACQEKLEKLTGIPQATQVILDKTPDFLLSPKAPSYEELEKADLSNFKIPKSLQPDHPFADPKSYVPILSLFRPLKEDADYLFVGNGYYIPYLMARSLFAGTPMENRIKFVAFSRPLASEAAKKPNDFYPYYQSLDLGKQSRKLVVIDSITSLEHGNKHSVISTSNSIRKFLIHRGWSPEKAIQSVVTMAMPEGSPGHDYRTRNLSDYFQRLSKIGVSNSEIASYPYFDPGIDYDQSPFKDSYSYSGNDFYWNGKYTALDSRGVPRGYTDIRAQLSKLDPAGLEFYINDRAQLASTYQEIIKYGKSNSRLFQTEIQGILKTLTSP